MDKAVRKFDSHLRKIAKHGGPTINDKPMYDPDTIERIRDAYHNFIGEYL